MKMIVHRHAIIIQPENEIDEAYIEDTLGLKKEGATILLKRVAPMGLPSRIAYLETVEE